MASEEGPIILFDGVCNLCNGAVKWVIRYDRHARFRFASLQSETARRLIAENGPSLQQGSGGRGSGMALPDSVVLIADGRVRVKSDAALGIARRLGWPWRAAAAGLIVPRVLRDAVYAWVARHRYRWFGKRDACMVPTPGMRARFLD